MLLSMRTKAGSAPLKYSSAAFWNSLSATSLSRAASIASKVGKRLQDQKKRRLRRDHGIEQADHRRSGALRGGSEMFGEKRIGAFRLRTVAQHDILEFDVHIVRAPRRQPRRRASPRLPRVPTKVLRVIEVG